jgi:hypothetical protein
LARRIAPKTARTRRYIIDVWTVRIAVVIMIGTKPQGRESLHGAATSGRGGDHAADR